jgi:hypothetical protein
MFNKDKTKWLNILHAGWPGGLALGGMITIVLGSHVTDDWRVLLYVLAVPALIYLVMLGKAQFPVNERVAAGTSYREMLGEFGVLGAALAGYLVIKQLGEVFGWGNGTVFGLLGALVVAYGLYCRSLGRGLIVLLCLVMLPLATTELGTDGAITGIMEEPLKLAGYNPLWVLIYTSLIMVVLRFFAGPIVRALTPLGLLATCSVLAIAGLWLLSRSTGLFAIFGAATLYGLGKTFFWPTTLGVVSEQSPKGGALTLNAIGGIGMLTAGVIGGPLIGEFQERSARVSIEDKLPGIYVQVSREDHYVLGTYTAIDAAKVATLPVETAERVNVIAKDARQRALASVTVFPAFMLAAYLGLIFWFKARGGYRPVSLNAGH